MIAESMLLLFEGTCVAVALALSTYVFFFAVVGLLPPKRKQGADRDCPPQTRFIVLIPAHNEAAGIKGTLESLRSQDYPANLFRNIVIADNCTDHTAVEVHSAGIECWVRNEPTLRGKGRALRWALDRLQEEPFDAVVFIDADSELLPGFLLAMDRELQAGAQALQACYDFADETTSEFSLLTIASKRGENRFFWRSRERLGLSSFILGNGFCLRAAILKQVPWDAYSIVEDLDYTIRLLLAGVRVQFVEDARVVSRPTSSAKDAFPQRLRWAAGTFQSIAAHFPKLLWASLWRRSMLPAEGAIALLLTSRFFIAYWLMASWLVTLLLHNSTATAAMRLGLLVATLIFCIYAGMVLSMAPRSTAGSKAVLALPFYVVWMLVVHGGAALGIRRRAWIRTAR